MPTVLARPAYQQTATDLVDFWPELTRRLRLDGLELLAVSATRTGVDLFCTGATPSSRDRLHRQAAYPLARVLGCEHLRFSPVDDQDLYIHVRLNAADQLRGRTPRLDRDELRACGW